MNDLIHDVKEKITKLYDSLPQKEKYCDGCFFLTVSPPFKGATSSDVNVWRDNYKCSCEQFNMIWTNSSEDKVIRVMECIVTDSKEI